MIVQEIEVDKCRVLAEVEDKGGTEVIEVLSYLQSHSEHKNARGLASLFENYAKGGAEGLTDKQFHPALNKDPNIYRFGKGKVRVYCFFDGPDVIVATHGARKQSQATSAEDMKTANEVRDRYFDAKKNNNLTVKKRERGKR